MISGDSFSRVSITSPHGKVDTPKSHYPKAPMWAPTRVHILVRTSKCPDLQPPTPTSPPTAAMDAPSIVNDPLGRVSDSSYGPWLIVQNRKKSASTPALKNQLAQSTSKNLETATTTGT
ncbi:hypothetical protein CDL15_Pgr013845 [Punica granatum]|uniref:Uncharacterized protein n=1 Tax=Punica granatum TaxID=22663 RepID=A0A218WJF2_PUNGR|nr:hypothetical protein CDL15_Pgr013845 [Punica granatum]PKI72092.1 hypothetical protein CRG98_007479 [Punica granatum]